MVLTFSLSNLSKDILRSLRRAMKLRSEVYCEYKIIKRVFDIVNKKQFVHKWIQSSSKERFTEHSFTRHLVTTAQQLKKRTVLKVLFAATKKAISSKDSCYIP